ncbi:MAG: hypothetical protein E6Q83_02530 [Thiothrix sp.]|nr:MAG: hypothetical protein E6Q83_02530 [Thiothrix sp.]
MRLKFYGFLLLALGLTTQTVSAIPKLPVPLKNLEIAGQVLQDGKPVANAMVNAYFYNCDNALQTSTTSNANGYYRLIIPSYPRVIYASCPEPCSPQPMPPEAVLELKKLKLAIPPNGINGYYSVPIFLSTHSLTNPTTTLCQQALKGGLETPLKNRFNLKLDGVPATASIPSTQAPIPPKPPVKPSEQQKCQAQGGQWEFISRGVKGCNLSYKDAGRTCTDGKQCSSGVCLAKERNPRASEGQCAASTFAIINGCLGEIKRGHWHSRACP